MSAVAAAVPEIAQPTFRDGKHRLDYSQFHQGQREAYHSTARFTLVLAGTQGGKTAVGPPWLLKQIKERGAGDYMVAAPNFTLMEKKALPEFLRLFQDAMHLGEYKAQIRKFVFSHEAARRMWGHDSLIPTQIYFGYGENPDSLESATLKAIWIDEGGQKAFKRESWDAILRRLSIEEGPVMLTTTPYTLGWLSELVRKADELGVRVINFPSLWNPRFPRSEWERAKRELPAWKFTMFYRGIFERPAGLIYDCWDAAKNSMPAFTIPDAWPRFLGLDFGGVNTAGIFVAEEQNAEGKATGRYIPYREYHAGGRTASQHAVALLQGEPRIPTTFGGSKSEGQWRQEFASAGLSIEPPPVAEVEVGINRVYGLMAQRNLIVLDALRGLLDQILSYSRVLDERGEPTEAIEDKDTFHYLDALRYVVAGITDPGPQYWIA